MKTCLSTCGVSLGVCGWACALARAAVLYVAPVGDDAQPGSSWLSARRTVTAGLAAARVGDEVWVAAGTYAEHLVLKDGVALYGGFAGTEPRREDRNWMEHRSVLDGTTNGVVVTLRRCGPQTVLDGFTIQNGLGKGVYCLESAGTIRNNLIRGNLGSDLLPYGGGVLVSGASLQGPVILESNRILDNANFDGGGIACIDASPRIEKNLIMWNLAYQNGGGISCWRNSSPFIANNWIAANTASWILHMPVPIGGGGIFATADDLDGRPHPTAVSAPVIVNNVVIANGAWHGGGVALVDSNGGVPSMINNTVVANNGSGIFWGSSSLPLVSTRPILRNNIVAYNAWGLEMAAGTPPNPNIEFNCVYGNQIQDTSSDYQGLPDQSGINGNFTRAPGLVDFEFGKVHLQPGSLCIDAGKASDNVPPLDIDGQPRVQGRAIDIGADESDGTLWPDERPVFHVSTQGNDLAAGRTWSEAKLTVRAGIDAAKLLGGEVWVAAGIYREHINLPAFVHLYGGFAGTETSREIRHLLDNRTVLDGEGEIKIVHCGNGGYLVSRLDGFTIRNGGKYTGGTGLSQYGKGGLGGGIYLGVSSPIIANNFITRNSLAHDNSPTVPQPSSYGAGLYAELSYAVIVGNTFQENEILNTFDGSGGGLYSTWSRPTILDNTFSLNHARYGAAIFSSFSSPVIRNNLVLSNAMYNTYPLPLYLGSPSGAITLQPGDHLLIEGNTIRGNTASAGAGLNVSGFTSGRIQNNLFLFNHAQEPMGSGGMGGGIYCLVMTNTVDDVVIANNTFVGNTAAIPLGEQGGALAITLAPPADRLIIANNLIVSNSSGIFQTPTTPMSRPTLLHNNLLNVRSNYINLPPGTTDFSLVALFLDAGLGDYRLAPGSPAIDTGTTSFAPSADKNTLPRSLDGNGDGVAAPDVGAFEYLLNDADSDGDGMPDGWEWENRLYPTFDDAGIDHDDDRMDNRAEYIAGTDPRDAASALRLAEILRPAVNILVISWLSVDGRSYLVESLDQLAAGAIWVQVGTPLVGTGSVLEVEVPVVAGVDRFYRISVKK